MEEDINMLKRIDIKFFLNGSIEQSDYIVETADKVNNAIENILTEREADKKRIKELEEKYILEKVAKEEVEELLAESIPKAKIKEKIEELIRFVGVAGLLLNQDEITATENQIEILEELLKDGGE